MPDERAQSRAWANVWSGSRAWRMAAAMVTAKTAEASWQTELGWVSWASSLAAAATSDGSRKAPQMPSGLMRISAPLAWLARLAAADAINVAHAFWTSAAETGSSACAVVLPTSNGLHQ